MNEADFREFIRKQRWIFARTYAAFAPHEYIVRGKNGVTDEEFFKAAEYILENGIPMFYYKHRRKYVFVDGHFYWLMGDEVNEDRVIINRCKPEDYDIVFMKRNTWMNKKPENVQLELDFGQGGNS